MAPPSAPPSSATAATTVPKSSIAPSLSSSSSRPTASMGSNAATANLPLSMPITHDPSALLDNLEKQRRAHPDVPFDPIAFLNQHYTTESALITQLPGLREAVSERMILLDDRISNALQRQSESAPATRQAVQEAKDSVAALEHRVRQVQEKASQSEQAVLAITSDMKRLDGAKKHLQRTITTLKRLHMLVRAVEQLRQTHQAQPFPDYAMAAQLVGAIHLLSSHFEGFMATIPQMKQLAATVTALETNLQRGLVRGFRIVAFGNKKATKLETANAKAQDAVAMTMSNDSAEDDDNHHDPDQAPRTAPSEPVMSTDMLQGGVALIDALGEDVRQRFIHEFCQDQLADYLADFAPPSNDASKPEKRVSSFKADQVKKVEPENKHASLEQVEQRFLWFRQVLQKLDKQFPQVFSPQWHLQVCLARTFLQLTRDHILALLDGPRKDPDASNAPILLKALQKTIVFEKEITVWLSKEYGAHFVGNEESEETAKTKDEALEPLIGIASGAFANYMSPYISLEEQSMNEQLAGALEDRSVDTRGEQPVFISSTNLFVYIKGSISRCTVLTRGNAFFLLYQAFKDAMRKYANILTRKLPSPHQGSSAPIVGGISLGGTFAGKPEAASNLSYRVPKGDEATVCQVINTCEYCADTLEALEDLIRDTIDQEYKAKVDMMPDQEIFHDLTAMCIRVLVSGLLNRVENPLKDMTNINWSTWEVVDEESKYVRAMHEEIEPYVSALRGLLPSSYFRNFCDKFASQFANAYWDTLIRLKRISEPGTQQLLLDAYNLKTLLLKLPVMEEASSSAKRSASGGSLIAPAMYTKMVQKHFGKMETLLKLVATPNDLLIDNFKVQWPNGSSLELQIVMSLKGMKRTEQAGWLERFGVDPAAALKGAAANVTSSKIVTERVQAFQDQSSTVAAKVNSDLYQMRQKVDDFRKQFT